MKEHVRSLLSYINRDEFEPSIMTHPDPEWDLWASSHSIPCLQLPISDGIKPVQDVGTVRKLLHLFLTIENDEGGPEVGKSSMRTCIVHAHGAKAASLTRFAGILGGKRRPLIIYTVHGLPLRNHLKPHVRAAALLTERLLWRSCDAFIAVSEDVKARFMEISGVREREITVIPNGIRIERFNGDFQKSQEVCNEFGLDRENDWIVGTATRLVPEKNLDIMLEGFARLKQRFRDNANSLSSAGPNTLGSCDGCRGDLSNRRPRLLIVGDGPLRQDLEDLAEKMGIKEDVAFAGSRRDVSSALSAMDVFVLTSLEDGMPLALMEAMAAGKPVVVPRCGSFPEVVRPSYGVLVPPGSPNTLSDAISDLLLNEQKRLRLGKLAKEYAVKHFDARLMAERTEELYRRVWQSKAAHGK